jgi:hypothetical protein
MVGGVVHAYPGCPTLSWMIANRVTNPYEESDAFISFVGRKGSSKSTSSIAFCEGLAEDIAHLRGKGEPPEKFFNLNHIKSITETGAMELLSSGALKEENSVFLLDDTGTQWSARSFQSLINKSLNSILQICRVYRCVLVANFIMKNHIDIQARGMTDYRAEMLYKNTTTGQAFFKFFYLEQSEYGEYKKYLTWHGKRVKVWVIEKPTDELNTAYKKMRRTNTDEYIDTAREKVNAKLNGEEPKPDKRIRDYAKNPVVIANREKVLSMRAAGKRPAAISRETGLSPWWVQRCLAPI